ncbi:MAG: hypothetical protein DCC65_06610 [Planctomycetota bacterium]|nr:MAG: hypothetical protein DCC65_06610 [Planctomycetota bacterium]
MIRTHLLRWSHVLLHPALALAATVGFAGSATADPIPAFKLETTEWYVQGGLEINPLAGVHDFIGLGPLPPPVPDPDPAPYLWETHMFNPACWCLSDYSMITPTRIIVNPGLDVSARGTSRHVSAPHPTDVVTWPPCPPNPIIPECYTFNFGVSLIEPPFGPFGARARRISGIRHHPAGHMDMYGAVVGVFSGTTPGPLLGPRVVIMHGSIGRHVGSPSARAFGGSLLPPSNTPSPGDLDFPCGEMMTLVDPLEARLSMLLIVEAVPAGSITQVHLRDGEFGPTLMDLAPSLVAHSSDPHATVMIAGDVALPAIALHALMTERAHLVVPIPNHPDGRISGAVRVAWTPGDMNCDGVLDGLDVDGFVQALTDRPQYEAMHPECRYDNADINGDGQVTEHDVAAFADAIVQ